MEDFDVDLKQVAGVGFYEKDFIKCLAVLFARLNSDERVTNKRHNPAISLPVTGRSGFIPVVSEIYDER